MAYKPEDSTGSRSRRSEDDFEHQGADESEMRRSDADEPEWLYDGETVKARRWSWGKFLWMRCRDWFTLKMGRF